MGVNKLRNGTAAKILKKILKGSKKIMKTNVQVNFKNSELIITKAFAKKASTYDSEAYNELMSMQECHPSFKICVKDSMKKKSPSAKSIINYTNMRKYVETHDESKELLKEFDKLKDGKTPFFEVKKWFFEHYPHMKNCKTKADWILAA